MSNIRILEVERVHKEKRKTNKVVNMTMVVKESRVRYRTRLVRSFSFMVCDYNLSP